MFFAIWIRFVGVSGNLAFQNRRSCGRLTILRLPANRGLARFIRHGRLVIFAVTISGVSLHKFRSVLSAGRFDSLAIFPAMTIGASIVRGHSLRVIVCRLTVASFGLGNHRGTVRCAGSFVGVLGRIVIFIGAGLVGGCARGMRGHASSLGSGGFGCSHTFLRSIGCSSGFNR